MTLEEELEVSLRFGEALTKLRDRRTTADNLCAQLASELSWAPRDIQTAQDARNFMWDVPRNCRAPSYAQAKAAVRKFGEADFKYRKAKKEYLDCIEPESRT